MFFQNLRSVAHTPGLFKTLDIIYMYIQSTDSKYSNIFESEHCHQDKYEYLYEHQSINILKYSNICAHPWHSFCFVHSLCILVL